MKGGPGKHDMRSVRYLFDELGLSVKDVSERLQIAEAGLQQYAPDNELPDVDAPDEDALSEALGLGTEPEPVKKPTVKKKAAPKKTVK